MIDINNLTKRAWAEISLDNIEYNYMQIRNRVPQRARICCVVKADAYGHGAEMVAKRLENVGVDFFAVATIEEALHLREANISSNILVLGYTPPARVTDLSENNISQCVYSCDYADLLAQSAFDKGVKVSVHIKIDVGMGRLGFIFRHGEDSFDEIIDICSKECFDPEGIFTHFPLADGGNATKEITKSQFECFENIIKELEKRGLHFKIRHCNNSAASIDYPEYALDMVRAGIALYGVPPSEDIISDITLKPTFTLKAVISNIKFVKKGDTIGYGATFVAPKDMKVAILAIGYADGYRRINYDNKSKVYVNGNACDIIGRICMDQTAISIDSVPDVNIGDEVVLFGEGSKTSIQDFAKNNLTIPYEIFCSVSGRVPRFYFSNNNG